MSLEKLLGFFDRLVGPAYRQDAELLYRARFLVALILVYEALMLGVCLWLLLLAPVVLENAMWSVLMIAAMMAAYSYVLYSLRYKDNYRFCIEASVFSAYAGIAVGIAISGGPMASYATPLMILPVVLAFCLSSRQSGLAWAAIVTLTHVVFIAVEQFGWVTFPQFLQVQYARTYHISHWLINYFALVALMLIFETTTRRLKAERDEERNKFKYLAAHDPLTGLANRSMFEEELDRSIARCKRGQRQLGLLLIDLDGFKPINDSLGHDAGDLVLKTVGERLRYVVRTNDTVARLGGDEFAIIVESINLPGDAERIGQKIIAEINRPYPGLARQLPVGASIGISVYPDFSEDPLELRKQADIAMYDAKQVKNCVALYRDPRVNGKAESIHS